MRGPRVGCLLLSLLLSLPLAGCGGEPATQDVVVFLIDTLRADHVGAYGYTRDTTPHIDALAGEGLLFERAYAPAPWTLPSVVSLMTSTFPCEHGVVVDGQQLSLSLVPLAERLRARGYATANFHANAFAGPLSGLDRGFDVSEARDFTDGERVGRWLADVGPERPVFLYVHNIEPHAPYKAATAEGSAPVPVLARDDVNRLLGRFQGLGRTDWSHGRTPGTTDVSAEQDAVMAELAALRETALTLYDADIRQADARFGSVIAALRAHGRFERSIIVLLSDHGEEFGEHGYWQHDQSLYDELVRVPLVLRLPGGRSAGVRVAEPVSLLDVVPTLADLLGAPALAENARGLSLSGWMEGGELRPGASPRVLSQRVNRKKHYAPFASQRGERNVAVVDRGWKAIWNEEPGDVELYALPKDGLERHDRSAEKNERAAALETVARDWLAGCQLEPPTVGGQTDPATLERLRALGYAE